MSDHSFSERTGTWLEYLHTAVSFAYAVYYTRKKIVYDLFSSRDPKNELNSFEH